MELLAQAKGVRLTLDNHFDAFQGLIRDGMPNIEIAGYVFTLSSPVNDIWFVHGFDSHGNPVSTAKFDQFDL